MVSNNFLPIVVGDQFTSIFETSDPENRAIDDEVENYLKSNPEGLTLKYDDKTYVLKMDQMSLNYQLYRSEGENLVLVDPDVQINSKFTPEGFIELGGLTANGSRIFIGRSPDSDQEEIIAFVERHDISSVASKPTGATILYGGQSVNQDPPPPVEDEIVEPTIVIPTVGSYAWFSDLPDGNYYSDGEFLYTSSGQLLGDCVYLEGIYKLEGGQGYIQHVADQQNIYLPVDTYDGAYIMSGSYKDQEGVNVKGSELSFELLTDLGISVDKIDVPYVFPALDGQNIEFTVASLGSSNNTDSWEHFIFVDGKVVGRTSFDTGDYFVQDGVTYKKVTSEGIQQSHAVDTFDGERLGA
jgi:hypothetical protein